VRYSNYGIAGICAGAQYFAVANNKMKQGAKTTPQGQTTTQPAPKTGPHLKDRAGHAVIAMQLVLNPATHLRDLQWFANQVIQHMTRDHSFIVAKGDIATRHEVLGTLGPGQKGWDEDMLSRQVTDEDDKLIGIMGIGKEYVLSIVSCSSLSQPVNRELNEKLRFLVQKEPSLKRSWMIQTGEMGYNALSGVVPLTIKARKIFIKS